MHVTPRFFNAIIESAIDAIIVINAHGIMSEANAAACRLFGYLEDEMIGKSVNMLMPDFHATRHDGYIRNYLETGQARIIGIGREVQGLKKDGKLLCMCRNCRIRKAIIKGT